MVLLVICCKLTQLQTDVYEAYVNSGALRETLKTNSFYEEAPKMTSSTLAAITTLKKLVNHPDLILDTCREKNVKEACDAFSQHLPSGYTPSKQKLQPELSGKLAVLDCLLGKFLLNCLYIAVGWKPLRTCWHC